MHRCRVCDRENSILNCSYCGYDGSTDYEQLPTLVPLLVNKEIPAVSARKKDRMNRVICKNCGSEFFRIMQTGNTYCAVCGASIIRERSLYVQSEKTATKKNLIVEIEKQISPEQMAMTAGNSHVHAKSENTVSKKNLVIEIEKKTPPAQMARIVMPTADCISRPIRPL